MSLSDFKYHFRSFHSTVDLLTCVSVSIARASNIKRVVVSNISKAFQTVSLASLSHKLSLMGSAKKILL